MRISKNIVNRHLQQELFRTLYQLVADLKKPEDVEKFFKAFLSETEHVTLSKRLAVAYWLDKGRNYSNINQNLKVSSATIAGIQENMKVDSVKLALQHIKAEEWANIWSQRIQKFVKGN